MAQKFTSLDEAADQLGISKDHLNQLREAGKVRAYRDGASWKFRSEDVEKLQAEGLPELDAGGSDISLGGSDLSLGAEKTEPPAKSDAGLSGLDIDLADEEPELGPPSDISLDDVDEPTVAGLDEGSDDALALDDDDSIDINKDSILLSEAELGGISGRPPSTIIGKAELDLDADLDLSPLDKSTPKSDVKLASGSDLLPSAASEEDLSLDIPDGSGDFAGLKELEVDLEAQSSRILGAEDVSKAQQAAKSEPTGLSDLGLAPLESGMALADSDVKLGGSSAGEVGLTGLSALELDDDEDQVLGEGSDVTLSGESSGINIISPSDSGLALDEVALDLSGSTPMGSSLDLGAVAEESSIEPLAMGGAQESGIGGDFQLTPLGEDDGDDEKDSSQVIALDDLSEESAGAPLPSGFGEPGMMAEDFGMVGLAPGAVPIGATSAQELPFSIGVVLLLASCMVGLGLCGMMTYDLLRNMWSWDEVATINSSLLEVLNPMIGK
ncbi:MAG: helix-turn-helix domain-containing protein [Pirellulales bacterium]|nr:helix-turn-helix domain-containing protein [Pirellulales bacterium]